MTSAAIQGVRGAFSHAAAIDALGGGVSVVACRTFEDLFRTVVEGGADHGIVPVENSLAGSVQRNLDLLLEHPLHAVAEARVRVRLCLAAPPGVELESVRRIASHPVALQQCHRFFSRHPRVEPVAAFDTAGSIQELMRGDASFDAAIGSELAARLYGARVLERGVEDDPRNFTRFLVVAREPAEDPGEPCKTSLVLRLRHEPGALHAALGVLVARGVDLTRLESRPIPGRPWEYRFYVDLRGPSADRQNEAVAALTAAAEEVRVLGRYRERGEA